MKKYWKSLEERTAPERSAVSHANRKSGNGDSLEEILDDKTLNAPSSRRDFLKIFGFSIASAAVVSSCEMHVRKAIPYLIRPMDVTPGVADYYATTFFDGQEYCSILAKVRDGRPIKIEGNEMSPVTKGGTNPRVQASVLNLYDDSRYREPSIDKIKTDWASVDKEITAKLEKLSSDSKEIVLLTSSMISPSAFAAIELFQKKYPSAKHIQYDTMSASGMLEANDLSFGKRAVPSYYFDKANLIVSFAADFLGTWLSPVEFAKQWASIRNLVDGQKKITKHIQFEPGYSMTGTNADVRVPMKPSQEKIILASLYNEIAEATGFPQFSAPVSPVDVKAYARELLKNKGRSLIISGSNDTDTQIIVNAINLALGNYGKTIDLANPMLHRKGSDKEMAEFVDGLDDGKVGGVIFLDTNPVYDYPESSKVTEGLKKADLTVAIASARSETADLSKYLCPDHHFLEAWDDYEIKPGKYSLAQPAIRPLFNTRQGMENLLKWSGNDMDYLDFVKDHWKKNMFPKSTHIDFFHFWTKCVQEGVYEQPVGSQENVSSLKDEALKNAFSAFPSQNNGIEIELYPKVSIGSGKHANNPWLQEMPDPVTRATWDNYVSISPKMAKEKGWKTFDVVTINDKFRLPVLVQPGQTQGTVSIAVGYGRTVAGKVAEGVGTNVFGLVTVKNGSRIYNNTVQKIEKTGSNYYMGITQPHASMEGRDLIHESSLKKYLKNPGAGNEAHQVVEGANESLYKNFDFPGHHWGMSIDLNKCIGCSACLIACTAENNVPVVGKREVIRVHEMHWIRLDRYFVGDEDYPMVVRQPVMCMQCDQAPCENVCPVGATNHSDEGLNQMIYNRCIGTRYCNNNCPYKVRRFNWFDYTGADSFKGNRVDPEGMTVDLRRMVLNPDVTVRAKGVIEKCTFCVQRIQAGKLKAKLEDRMLKDGEIRTACQQACPADAIVFGDTNDPNSKVSKLLKDPRSYGLLEELHILPSVGYLTKISYREQEG